MNIVENNQIIYWQVFIKILMMKTLSNIGDIYWWDEYNKFCVMKIIQSNLQTSQSITKHLIWTLVQWQVCDNNRISLMSGQIEFDIIIRDRSYRTVASSTSAVSNDRREHRDNSTSQNQTISKYSNMTKTHWIRIWSKKKKSITDIDLMLNHHHRN